MSKRSQPQLERLIRQRAKEDTASFVFTHHARVRMRQRNITMPMALDCLRNGRIFSTPEPNSVFGTTECRMQHYVAGRHIALVVAVSETDPDLFIVTAMNIED
jgi:hypothetical protein